VILDINCFAEVIFLLNLNNNMIAARNLLGFDLMVIPNPLNIDMWNFVLSS
jgi:hypothetical protein